MVGKGSADHSSLSLSSHARSSCGTASPSHSHSHSTSACARGSCGVVWCGVARVLNAAERLLQVEVRGTGAGCDVG